MSQANQRRGGRRRRRRRSHRESVDASSASGTKKKKGFRIGKVWKFLARAFRSKSSKSRVRDLEGLRPEDAENPIERVLIQRHLKEKRQREEGGGGDGQPGLTSTSSLEMGVDQTKRQWITAWESVEMKQSLGSGASGRVFRGTWYGSPVAVKLIKLELTMRKGRTYYSSEAAQREIDLALRVNHPNVVSFYSCAKRPREVALIMELAEHGDLQTYLHRSLRDEKSQPFPTLRQRLRWLQQISAAVACLHLQYRICHRDLKLGNVVLCTNLVAKLCDFGLSKEMYDKRHTRGIGTDFYRAPEVMVGLGCLDKELSSSEATIYAADVFSLGVISFQVLTFLVGNPYALAPRLRKVYPHCMPEVDLDNPALRLNLEETVIVSEGSQVDQKDSRKRSVETHLQHLEFLNTKARVAANLSLNVAMDPLLRPVFPATKGDVWATGNNPGELGWMAKLIWRAMQANPSLRPSAAEFAKVIDLQLDEFKPGSLIDQLVSTELQRKKKEKPIVPGIEVGMGRFGKEGERKKRSGISSGGRSLSMDILQRRPKPSTLIDKPLRVKFEPEEDPRSSDDAWKPILVIPRSPQSRIESPTTPPPPAAAAATALSPIPQYVKAPTDVRLPPTPIRGQPIPPPPLIYQKTVTMFGPDGVDDDEDWEEMDTDSDWEEEEGEEGFVLVTDSHGWGEDIIETSEGGIPPVYGQFELSVVADRGVPEDEVRILVEAEVKRFREEHSTTGDDLNVIVYLKHREISPPSAVAVPPVGPEEDPPDVLDPDDGWMSCPEEEEEEEEGD